MNRPWSVFFRALFSVLLVVLLFGLFGCSAEGEDSDAEVSAGPVADAEGSGDSAPTVESPQAFEPPLTTAGTTAPPTVADSLPDSEGASSTSSTTQLTTTTSTLSPSLTASPRDEEAERAGGLIAFLRGEGLSGDASQAGGEISDGSAQAFELAAQQLFQFHCGFEIFIMNSDGSSVRQVTENTTRVTEPVWSPDGSRFLYEDMGPPEFGEGGCDQGGDVQGDPGLFVVDAETLVNRLVTHDGLFVYDFLGSGFKAWSPDGSKFGFMGGVLVGDDVSDEGLYVVEGDGSGTRLLVPIPGDAFWTAWSWAPDGSAIAFSLADPTGGDLEIFVVDVETAAIRQLTDNDRNDDYPVWSNDGSRIAYLGGPPYQEGFTLAVEMYVSDSDGTSERRVTDLGAILSDLRWAPDDSAVLFRYTPNDLESDAFDWSLFGLAEIFKVEIDGTSVTQLTELQEMMRGLEEDQRTVAVLLSVPVWAPDLSQVAFATFSEATLNAGPSFPDAISIVDFDHRLTHTIATGIGPVFSLAWSPDSSKMLVMAGTDEHATMFTGNVEIYALDVADGTMERLTYYEGIDSRPAWAQPGE